jgi:hypothetical protein
MTVAHQIETTEFAFVLLKEFEQIAKRSQRSDQLETVTETDANET